MRPYQDFSTVLAIKGTVCNHVDHAAYRTIPILHAPRPMNNLDAIDSRNGYSIPRNE